MFARESLEGPGIRPTKLPHVSGGEVSGRVDALGPAAEGWSEGERVTLLSCRSRASAASPPAAASPSAEQRAATDRASAFSLPHRKDQGAGDVACELQPHAIRLTTTASNETSDPDLSSTRSATATCRRAAATRVSAFRPGTWSPRQVPRPSGVSAAPTARRSRSQFEGNLFSTDEGLSVPMIALRREEALLHQEDRHRHGAFMEPGRRNQRQPRGKSNRPKNGSKQAKRFAIATSCQGHRW